MDGEINEQEFINIMTDGAWVRRSIGTGVLEVL